AQAGRESAMDAPLLRIFVYGTLKRGGRFHDRFCGGALDIEEATVAGRVHTLPAGYPGLVVPRQSILAEGTAEALADVAAQARLEAAGGFSADGGEMPDADGWRRIGGEILTFDDPAERLALLDDLEDFHPGAPSLSRRSLLAVRAERSLRSVLAWTYVVDSVVSSARA
ncbi:MAG: gamma-glutamylcyclotransferase family protein, partial [Candidatus Binatia bacterium]